MRRALERTMAEVERLKAELNCKPEACDMPDACGYAIENAALREQLAENTRKWAHAEVERNAILKAANEHTGSCFAERDQLKATITDLVEALGSVLEGLGNPRTVHIGYACQRYEVTYPGLSEDNPIERARKALARAKEVKP